MRALLFALLTVTPAWSARGPLTDVALTNQEGKVFRLHELKGKYLLVSFVYARCPMAEMCPLTMRLVNRTLKEWKKQLPEKSVHALTVTLDPQTDTPAVLKKFGQSHRVDFQASTLATGNEKTLESFASQFNVIGIPSAGTISHNMKTVLVGPDLVPIKDFKENEWKPEDVLAAVRRGPT